MGMDQHLVKVVAIHHQETRPEGLSPDVSHLLVEVGYWRNNHILDKILDEILGDDGYERHDSGLRNNQLTEITEQVDELVHTLEFALSDPDRQIAPISRILRAAGERGVDVENELREAIIPFLPYVGTDERLMYQADF
jgi:hypothetical protein